MPLTYCRMRVNVNEKYIIHTPQEWSQPGCLVFMRRGRQSTPTPFIISFIDFLFFVWGEGGGGTDVWNYTVLRINFFVTFQTKLCVAQHWHLPTFCCWKWQYRDTCVFSQNYLQLNMRTTCNDVTCWFIFPLSGSPVAVTSALLFLGSILKSLV